VVPTREADSHGRRHAGGWLKLNYGDPLAWLTDVLVRILAGNAKQPTPLPWSWKATKLDAIFM
jgi:hypothetical protein